MGNFCSNCSYDLINNNYIGAKRPHYIFQSQENDTIEKLMNGLKLEEVN